MINISTITYGSIEIIISIFIPRYCTVPSKANSNSISIKHSRNNFCKLMNIIPLLVIILHSILYHNTRKYHEVMMLLLILTRRNTFNYVKKLRIELFEVQFFNQSICTNYYIVKNISCKINIFTRIYKSWAKMR